MSVVCYHLKSSSLSYATTNKSNSLSRRSSHTGCLPESKSKRSALGAKKYEGLNLAAALVLSLAPSGIALANSNGLAVYENLKNGYQLERPAEWEEVDKAGADALFKAPELKATDLGVTVTPIRISSLKQLGNLQSVGEKLLKTEQAKESNKKTEMLAQTSRISKHGTTFYEYDYTVSTTRGDKRILSSVGVAMNKLYIVNGSIRCEGARCLEDSSIVELVRQSVKSFDVLSQ